MVAHSESACASEKECLQLQAQLRTVLCVVKNNIPANRSNFVSLLELQKVNGAQSLKTGEIYTQVCARFFVVVKNNNLLGIIEKSLK